MWLLVFPALALILYLCVFATGHHPSPPVHPQPFSCHSEMSALAPLGAGGQIAPLCGATPYPSIGENG